MSLTVELEQARKRYQAGQTGVDVLAYYHKLGQLNRNGELERLLRAIDAWLNWDEKSVTLATLEKQIASDYYAVVEAGARES